MIENKNGSYFIVPESLHDPIVQSFGLVKTTTRTTQAFQFIDFLTSKDAARIWKKYGYGLPGKAKR